MNSRAPDGAELSAVTALLDASERQARVGRDDRVDEQRAGLDLPADGESMLLVSRPDAGAESVRRQVGQAYGVLVVVEADDGGCRAEGLLRHDRHVGGDVDEHGRGIPGRAVLEGPSTHQRTCTRLDGGFDLLVEAFGEVGAGEWADPGGGVRRVTHREGRDRVGETATELIDHGPVDDEPLSGQAALATVEEAGRDGLGHHLVEIGVLKDHEGVRPT